KSAPTPVAVFSSPLLSTSVPAPTAVLKLPVVRLMSENQPTAVLKPPVVRLKRAFCPSAVLPPGYAPSGARLTAVIVGKSPKQTNATRNSGVAFLNWINGFTGIFPFSFPALLILRLRVRKGRRTQRGKSPPPDSDPF